MQSFSEHPVLESLSAEDDPAQKINAMMNVSDSDMNDMLKFLVIASEENGKYLTKLSSDDSQSENELSDKHKKSILNNIALTLNSLGNLSKILAQKNVHAGHSRANSVPSSSESMDR